MLGQVLLGKYRIIRQVAEGGMSKIYLARQDNPARDVVVKVLKEPLRLHTKSVEHFRREIHIMSRFQHRHSVEVYDSATKTPYGPVMVMELLRGVDMADLLYRDRRFTPERTGRFLGQICDVLEAAHEQGIVHRDLKPGNLMVLHPGTSLEIVKLMDYGLAKMSSMLYISPEELVDFNLPPASGTPEYISPEMVRGVELDARADLYSLGVVLYEMLTGKRPFNHPSIEGLMVAHANEAPPSFARIGLPNVVPPAIEAVVMSCLAKYPDQRPASAWQLGQAYERALGRRILPSRPMPTMARKSGTVPVVNGALGPVTPAPPTAVDRNAFRHSVEVRMVEAMAMIKLKGFVFDLGGEVVESIPGMIKVRLVDQKAEKRKESLMGWVSSVGSRQISLKPNLTEIDLHMERLDPDDNNKLTITLVMRPGSGGLATAEWRNRCKEISRDLQAYLMG